MSSPLPNGYYYFFWLVEPALTLIGAGYAIFQPSKYGADLLPNKTERVTMIIGETSRGQMLIGGLGSCFFLLAMISLSLFPIIRNNLQQLPVVQEKLVKGLLVPLAIADISHVFLTLIPLPMSLLQTPSEWTTLINGNVWITCALFAVRISYFLGIGRAVIPKSSKQTPRAKAKVSTDQQTPVKSHPAAIGDEDVPANAHPAATPGTRARGKGKKTA